MANLREPTVSPLQYKESYSIMNTMGATQSFDWLSVDISVFAGFPHSCSIRIYVTVGVGEFKMHTRLCAVSFAETKLIERCQNVVIATSALYRRPGLQMRRKHCYIYVPHAYDCADAAHMSRFTRASCN